MLPFARKVLEIICLKLKLQKQHENRKLSKCSIIRHNDNENTSGKN